MVWARTTFLHLVQPIPQLGIESRIVDVTYHVVESLFKVLPSRLAELACIFRLGGCLPSLLAKLFSTHRSAADSENFEFRVHAPFTGEVVQTRHQLPLPQATRTSQNNQDTRT